MPLGVYNVYNCILRHICDDPIYQFACMLYPVSVMFLVMMVVLCCTRVDNPWCKYCSRYYTRETAAIKKANNGSYVII